MKEIDNDVSRAWRHEVPAMCPILYQMMSHDIYETCMCWGFECGDGWMVPLTDMSCELEELNREYYNTYRIRIQMDQVKEKYGTLRAYYSVVVDPGMFGTAFNNIFHMIYSKLTKINYARKRVVDVEPFDYDETSYITIEKYEDEVKYKCSNVDYEVIDDTQVKKVTHLKNYGKHHYVATKHKLAYMLMMLSIRLSCTFSACGKELTSEQERIKNLMDRRAEMIVRKAEDDCYKVCEECGCQIGTLWSPRCETRGWITYICDRCAEKHNAEYIKNSEVWRGTSCIQTKEEFKAGNH
jgi:hypothetical protein